LLPPPCAPESSLETRSPPCPRNHYDLARRWGRQTRHRRAPHRHRRLGKQSCADCVTLHRRCCPPLEMSLRSIPTNAPVSTGVDARTWARWRVRVPLRVHSVYHSVYTPCTTWRTFTSEMFSCCVQRLTCRRSMRKREKRNYRTPVVLPRQANLIAEGRPRIGTSNRTNSRSRGTRRTRAWDVGRYLGGAECSEHASNFLSRGPCALRTCWASGYGSVHMGSRGASQGRAPDFGPDSMPSPMTASVGVGSACPRKEPLPKGVCRSPAGIAACSV
jgi:hypothetical protein